MTPLITNTNTQIRRTCYPTLSTILASVTRVAEAFAALTDSVARARLATTSSCAILRLLALRTGVPRLTEALAKLALTMAAAVARAAHDAAVEAFEARAAGAVAVLANTIATAILGTWPSQVVVRRDEVAQDLLAVQGRLAHLVWLFVREHRGHGQQPLVEDGRAVHLLQ